MNSKLIEENIIYVVLIGVFLFGLGSALQVIYPVYADATGRAIFPVQTYIGWWLAALGFSICGAIAWVYISPRIFHS